MKEESVVARHYAAKFDGLTRVEYIGDRPKEVCIKQIDLNSQFRSVSFSSDGKRIVSGSRDAVCIWDVMNGGLVIGPLEGSSLSDTPCTYGKYITLGYGVDRHNAWDAVAFSNDGKYIALGNRNATIGIWNAVTGERIHGPLEGHVGGISSVVFSPDSKYMASGSKDKSKYPNMGC